MSNLVVVGTQWGDEGKGKVVDLLSEKVKVIVRSQGGHNAGHTVIVGNQEFKLHLIPSGILHAHTECFIGAGTVIDPEVFLKEINMLQSLGINVKDRLWISESAHMIFPYHKLLDTLAEQNKGSSLIGTTHSGIGPCYADKINRIGIRIGDLFQPTKLKEKLTAVLEEKNHILKKLYEHSILDFNSVFQTYSSYAKQLRPFVGAVESKISSHILNKQPCLLEGAQGTFLDVTWGTYPYVTSSSTTMAGICMGAGIAPAHIDHVLGIAKAYTTRVGNGPFPTMFHQVAGFPSQQEARELGTTTGRLRRMGWFDAVLVKEAVRLNGINFLALTKLDILDNVEKIKICIGYQFQDRIYNDLIDVRNHLYEVIPVYEELSGWKSSTTDIKAYEQLPQEARIYIQRIAELCGVSIALISVGPERTQTIAMTDIFTMSCEKISS